MATNTKEISKKLKVGSYVKVDLICEITGKPFQVGILVAQSNDTKIVFEFKAKKWYDLQTAAEKQAIADSL